MVTTSKKPTKGDEAFCVACGTCPKPKGDNNPPPLNCTLPSHVRCENLARKPLGYVGEYKTCQRHFGYEHDDAIVERHRNADRRGSSNRKRLCIVDGCVRYRRGGKKCNFKCTTHWNEDQETSRWFPQEGAAAASASSQAFCLACGTCPMPKGDNDPPPLNCALPGHVRCENLARKPLGYVGEYKTCQRHFGYEHDDAIVERHRNADRRGSSNRKRLCIVDGCVRYRRGGKKCNFKCTTHWNEDQETSRWSPQEGAAAASAEWAPPPDLPVAPSQSSALPPPSDAFQTQALPSAFRSDNSRAARILNQNLVIQGLQQTLKLQQETKLDTAVIEGMITSELAKLQKMIEEEGEADNFASV
mmetsp:Transcript_364/g.820  ORF Transcript_364/g.820 Transcript_364/m.820 type:complete len:359 (-) Transcript_364:3653-4729(-)